MTSILDRLNASFSVSAKESPATKSGIERLKGFSGFEVPSDYLDLVRVATEVEFNIEGKAHMRIWGPDGCIEMNEAYSIQQFIPQSLAIGDDEGGRAILFMSGVQGFGLYLTGFGDLDPESARYISSSLERLLVDGEGKELLM